MIQIDDFAARALMRFGAEILDIDSRSRCSDKYFRQHFTMLAKNPYVRDAFLTLSRALDASSSGDEPIAVQEVAAETDTTEGAYSVWRRRSPEA